MQSMNQATKDQYTANRLWDSFTHEQRREVQKVYAGGASWNGAIITVALRGAGE